MMNTRLGSAGSRVFLLGAALLPFGKMSMWFTALLVAVGTLGAEPATLQVGFGKADITPSLASPRGVWLAGSGQNRKATGIHDPLWVRAFVLDDGT